MLRTRAAGGGLGRLCGWTGPAPAVGGAGLPLGLLLSPPASSSSAAAVAPASLLGGLRLVGHRPSPPSSTAIPALLRMSVLDGDRHHRQQPPPLASTMAAAGGRGGWRQAAAVLQQQQQALVQARGRRPFGTSARSTTGGSSAEGGAGGGGGHGGPPGGLKDGKQAGAGAGAGKDGAEAEEEGEGKVGKIRLMVRRYGPVAIVTYLGVYVTTLGLLFGAVEAGVNPFDYGVDSGNMVEKATGMLEGYSWGEPVVEAIRKNPHVGNFALAWILTKFTEPLRALVTIGIVPRIARALGRTPPLPRRGD